MMFRREWGDAHADTPTVIALHPLGLDSSGFEGFGRVLATRRVRTVAADLPGFGRTPAPDLPLRPEVLAAPVIELAREMPRPPVVLGISLGGRVALEAALTAPEAFRAVIAIAPGLPWLRYRLLTRGASWLSPTMADWIPLEHAWPALRSLAGFLETAPWIRDDEIAQAGARFVYFLSCPATRTAFFSAARELALDPAHGRRGLWTRLPGLTPPAAFVWGERDQLISSRFAGPVARSLPRATQLLLPCVGHWLNGPHHLCLADAVARLVTDAHASLEPSTARDPAPSADAVARGASGRRRDAGATDEQRRIGRALLHTRPCLVADGGLGTALAPAHVPLGDF